MTPLRIMATAGLLALSPVSWAALADLDGSFGSGGTMRYNAGSNNDFVSHTFATPAGTVYVLGYQYDIQNGGAVNDRVFILRLTSGGTVASKLTIPRDNLGPLTPYAIHVDEVQQRIYLLGAHIGVSNGNSSRFGIGRLFMDGQFDPSFGNGGIAYIEAPVTSGSYSYDNIAGTMALQSDGRIVVAGVRSLIGGTDKLALARFSATGAPDTTFGSPDSTGGFMVMDFGQPREGAIGVMVTSTGAIMVIAASGTSYATVRPVLLRLTSAGVPDTTFAPNGYIVDGLNGLHTTVTPMLSEDGKLTLAGALWADDASRIDRSMILRFTADGARDAGFATNGLYTEPAGQVIFSGARLPSGKVVNAFYGPGAGNGDVYDVHAVRMAGSSVLATPGYTEPVAESTGGGTMPLALLGLLALVSIIRPARLPTRVVSHGNTNTGALR